MSISRQDKDRIIAGAVTMFVVALLLVILFVGRVGWNRDALAALSMPENGQEEVFLEPELIPEAGDNEDPLADQPAAPVAGEPELAESENSKVADIQPEPAIAPPKEKIVTQKQNSPLKEPKPKGEEEKKKATSAVAGKFNQPNGLTEGKFDSSGSGGNSIGVSGHMNGRNFLGCPKPDVTLSHKTVVKVSITVNAEGHVTSAQAQGGASAAIRRACEQAARQARWSEKPGAVSTRGSITFTITPR